MTSQRVKEEPDCDVIDYGIIKKEMEPIYEEIQTVKEDPDYDNSADTSEAALTALYTDHVVKDELVLGPERPHRPHIDLVVRSTNSKNDCSSGSPRPEDEDGSSGKQGGLPQRPAAGHPYPSEEGKRTMAAQTGLNLQQVNNWLNKPRHKILQPIMVYADKPGTNSNNSCSAISGSSRPEGKDKSRGKRRLLLLLATQDIRAWLLQHREHPYPTEEQKRILAAQTGLTLRQINNWFTKARRRILHHRLDRSNKPGTNSNNAVSGVSGSSRPEGEDNSRGKRRRLLLRARQEMGAWLLQHREHPYPTEEEKRTLAAQTGLTLRQISNWFTKARRRILHHRLDRSNKPGTNSNNSCSGVSGSSRPEGEDNSRGKHRRLLLRARQEMRAWLLQHREHPYPTEEEKHTLAAQTGLTLRQISTWFMNARRRIL